MKIGSNAHKELFCQSFMESHKAFEPEHLPWPHLDDTALSRLREIPFWEAALNTEQEAGAMVSGYAARIADPLVHEAIALQGKEEDRHARLIQFMIQHYDIKISGRPPDPVPNNIEQAFIDFGYGECLDSFLAFGLFKIARQANFLPEQMFTIFAHILQEEARHIVFFVNWVAYLQASQGRGAKLFRSGHSLWHYGKAVQHLFGIVSSSSNSSGEGFTATGASTFIDDLSLEMFLSNSLQENQRRMSSFDSRLLRPQLLPGLATVALSTLKWLPKRNPSHQEKNSFSSAEHS